MQDFSRPALLVEHLPDQQLVYQRVVKVDWNLHQRAPGPGGGGEQYSQQKQARGFTRPAKVMKAVKNHCAIQPAQLKSIVRRKVP